MKNSKRFILYYLYKILKLEESLTFPINCHVCMREGLNKMCIVSVPYFKEITIMSFNCDFCGAKNSDVKVGGGISEKGIRITLNVESEDDLKRGNKY